MNEDTFRIGEAVQLRGQPGERGHIIEGPRQGADGPSYRVTFGDRVVWVSASRLERSSLERMAWVSKRRFLRDLAVLKLLHPLSDVLYSIGASRARFLVYQFQPVLKFVQSLPHGVLIADEVGLGKTIEAGLILKELIARGAVRRVLVVCPANLREKWRMEMQQRFGLQFRDIGANDIRTIRRDVERGEWPDFFGIASLEGLRRDELREVIEETGIQFDLVIVDEAHHLRNPQTLSFELGETLSDQADHILLLSATPVQTGAQDLLSLLRLVEPGQFKGTSAQELDELLEPNAYINRALASLSKPEADGPAIAEELRKALGTALGKAFEENALFSECLRRLSSGPRLTPDAIAEIRRDFQRLHTLAPFFTRTRKREVAETAKRKSRTIRVPLTNEEAAFYRSWVEYLVALAHHKAPSAPIAWVISMRERQAASSLQAATAVLDGLLANEPPSGIESSDPELTELSPTARIEDYALGRQRDAVVDAASKLSDTDTKADMLVDLIRKMVQEKPGRKILLFTFFKGTLRHLSKRLRAASIRHSAISGDDAPDRRADIVSAFQEDPEAVVLLSTEVGSEGLDFQFCDVVVNYDLPWNPMRVEQRIGRIDRFGQKEPVVQVVSFFVEGTIDTRILDRLYDRIHVFEESIGELEPILGPVVQQLQADIFTSALSEDEMRERGEDAIRRVEALRLQYEEFEATRAELMGQGDLIRQQVESTKASGRYTSPAELEALVADWLDGRRRSQAFETIEPTRRPSVFNLRLSQETIGKVVDWMSRQQRRDPMAQRLLNKIQQEGNSWCTFDSEIAQQYDNLPFIDVGHPLVRVALEDAKGRPPPAAMERVCSARLPGHDGWPADFALFLYRLEVSGADHQSTLLPVVVDLALGEVQEDLGDEVLGLLMDAEDGGSLPGVDVGTLEVLEQMAFEYADRRRSATERWSADTQQARLATTKAALERNYSTRLARKEELLGQVVDPRIRRLHEGEMRNLQSALQAKLAELEAAPEPVAAFELMAVALITTDQPGRER